MLHKPNIVPTVFLFIAAVPIGDFCAAFGRHFRQSVIVGRPEYVPDRPVREGFEVPLHRIIFFPAVMPRRSKPFRRKCRFQHLTVACHRSEGQHIPRQQQLSHQKRQAIGSHTAVNDCPANGNFPQGQQTGQTRTAQRAAVGSIQMGNTVDIQILGHLVHSLLHGSKVSRIFRLVTVEHHLKNMPPLGQDRNGVRKCPYGLCRAGKKQQRFSMLPSALQNLHRLLLLLHIFRI